MLDLIERRFASRLLATSDAENALSLYEDAQLIPGTSTTSILFDQHGLRLNGPFSDQLPPSILTGTRATGQPCIVKLLKALTSSRRSEASVCEELQLAAANAADVPVVEAWVHTLTLTKEHGWTVKHGPGEYQVLVMPQYCRVVSDLPELEEAAIADGGTRLVQAIEYIHEKKFVHMDIKVSYAFRNSCYVLLQCVSASMTFDATIRGDFELSL